MNLFVLDETRNCIQCVFVSQYDIRAQNNLFCRALRFRFWKCGTTDPDGVNTVWGLKSRKLEFGAAGAGGWTLVARPSPVIIIASR